MKMRRVTRIKIMNKIEERKSKKEKKEVRERRDVKKMQNKSKKMKIIRKCNEIGNKKRMRGGKRNGTDIKNERKEQWEQMAPNRLCVLSKLCRSSDHIFDSQKFPKGGGGDGSHGPILDPPLQSSSIWRVRETNFNFLKIRTYCFVLQITLHSNVLQGVYSLHFIS